MTRNARTSLTCAAALATVIAIAASVAHAAPYYTQQPTIIPQADNAFDLGTSTARWRNLYLSGTCTGCGSGSVFPFTTTIFGATTANATSTLIGFTNGLYSLATSTVGNGTQAGGLTVAGGATTTLNAYFASKVGIGTTSPGSLLSVQGVANFTTATSSFYSSGGIDLTGGGCFATAGECLQTFIQNASAYKSAANYATAAVLAGTPTYGNGASGVGATLTEIGFGALAVDGASPTAGQRILVKNQADQTQNGVYTVTATGSGIASYVLTRATDFNTANDIYAGVTVPVLAGGTANGDTVWTESTTGTITVGSSNIVFIETSIGTAAATFAYLFPGNATTTGLGIYASSTIGNSTQTGGLTIAGGATTTGNAYFAGNLGLGTTSPTNTFGVNGYIDVSGISGGYKFDGNKFIYASSTNFATVMGIGAGTSLDATSTILNDTAIGYQALNTAPTNGNTGANTAIGYRALKVITTGSNNTAVGAQAGVTINTGSNNVLVGGSFTGTSINSGSNNVCVGAVTCASLTTGSNNVALGRSALRFANTTSASSTALGFQAGQGSATYVTTGSTYVGANSGAIVSGSSDYNAFFGTLSGGANTTGYDNTFIGSYAGANVTTGANNIALGWNTNFPDASASNQLNIGNILFGSNLTATSSSGSVPAINGFIGIGTSTPRWALNVVASTSPQLTIGNGNGENPWSLRSTGGALYFATSSAATFATSSVSALTLDTNGIPTFPALGGVTGCAQFDTTGKVSNTGTACGTSSSFAFPWTPATNFSANTNSTSTPIWTRAGLFASSTSQFDQINVGSSTVSTMATSTFYGNINVIGFASSTGFYAGNGTNALPSYTFTSDQKTGIYLQAPSTHIIDIVSNGAIISNWSSAGLTVNTVGTVVPVGSAGAPSYSFSANTTYGLFGGAFVGVAVNGLEAARFTPGGWLGVGTSTPQWLLTLASSTAAQLTLSDGAAGNLWTMRGVGGNLYFATSSPATFATSTKSALTIDTNGILTTPALAGLSCIGTDSTGKFGAGTCSGGSPAGSDGQLQYKSGSALAAVSTTTLSISGPLSLTAGNGYLVGGVNATIGWSGLATSSAIANTQVLYATGVSGVAGSNNHVWNNAAGWLGIGTTTPQWLLTLATSTAPQLVITDNVANGWAFRDAGNYLYLSTTNLGTFATSTNPVLTLFNNGHIGIGTTTPWGTLSIASSTYNYADPLFVVATSTTSWGSLVTISATTTTLASLQNPLGAVLDSGVRFVIGAMNYVGSVWSSLDQLFVNGRINTGDWHYVECSGVSGPVSADANAACGPFGFQADTSGSLSVSVLVNTADGLIENCVSTSAASCNNPGSAATGVGAGLFFPSTSNAAVFRMGTSTPVMEAVARNESPQNSTSTQIYIGFTNVNPLGTTFEVAPTAGCYFTASSTQANWFAVCSTTITAMTVVNTGFASTSNIAQTGGFYRFRIEADQGGARFYMGSSTAALAQVANITANIPTTASLNAGVYIAASAAGLAKTLDINVIKLWFNQPALNYPY